MNSDGKYYIYDHNNRLISDEYLEELANEMTDKEIGYDDLLISSLITLAPNRIIIHPSHNITKKEIINTIEKVFSGKVEICSGCKICINIRNAIKE
jgi:putative sporulation protein YtxC